MGKKCHYFLTLVVACGQRGLLGFRSVEQSGVHVHVYNPQYQAVGQELCAYPVICAWRMFFFSFPAHVFNISEIIYLCVF